MSEFELSINFIDLFFASISICVWSKFVQEHASTVFRRGEKVEKKLADAKSRQIKRNARTQNE